MLLLQQAALLACAVRCPFTVQFVPHEAHTSLVAQLSASFKFGSVRQHAAHAARRSCTRRWVGIAAKGCASVAAARPTALATRAQSNAVYALDDSDDVPPAANGGPGQTRVRGRSLSLRCTAAAAVWCNAGQRVATRYATMRRGTTLCDALPRGVARCNAA